MELKQQRTAKVQAQLIKLEMEALQKPVGFTIAIPRPSVNIIIEKQRSTYLYRLFRRARDGTSLARASFESETIISGYLRAVAMMQSLDILRIKARAYKVRKKYLTVKLWTKQLETLRLVEKAFGGGIHRHGSGFYWICSKKSELRLLRDFLGSDIKEKMELLKELE